VKYYPVFLDIRDKRCVVVGGGDVAARKVRRLVGCGAQVVVVSPQLNDELIALKAENSIEHIADRYHLRHIEGAILVIGATNDDAVNASVSQDARALGIKVNIVDDPQKCDFILPSIVERGDLVIAVGTGGKSPALARHLREELESRYGAEYEILLKILGKLRPFMKDSGTGKAWFDELLSVGILDLIRKGNWKELKSRIRELTGEEVDIG